MIIVKENNRKDNLEKFMIMIGMSLMGGFGFVTLMCGVFQIPLLRFSALTIAGLVVGMSGLFLGILLMEQWKSQR